MGSYREIWLECRLLLALMLSIAFLNPGQAQASGEMPAELEISLDRAAHHGLGYHLSGTIPLQLSDRDGIFSVKTQVRAYWRATPAYRNCRSGVAFIRVQGVGTQDQDRITLALSLAPEVFRPACGGDRPRETAYKIMANTGNPDSTEFILLFADGSSDERTVDDSPRLGKLTGKLTLHLACPVKFVVNESAPVVSVSPTDTAPWPLLLDDSKTSAELSALASSPSGVVGLTRPKKPYPPVALFRPASRPAALRQGFCLWVNSIQVDFAPVEILLASKYPAGSCEYNVIREHEMLHYQDLQTLFRRYQALVTAALPQAGLPTVERPIFVGSVMDGTDQIKIRLQSALQPIYALMEKALLEDTAARDAPEQRELSWSKCPSWDARLTRMQH
jgi:hypothetical protein